MPSLPLEQQIAWSCGSVNSYAIRKLASCGAGKGSSCVPVGMIDGIQTNRQIDQPCGVFSSQKHAVDPALRPVGGEPAVPFPNRPPRTELSS